METRENIYRTAAASVMSYRPTIRTRIRHYSGDGLTLIREEEFDAVSTADTLATYLRLEGIDTEATEDGILADADVRADDDRIVMERRDTISRVMTAQIEAIAIP